MIISLRGCSGAGKSTVAFEIMKRWPFKELLDGTGKIMGYQGDIGLDKPLLIVGKYKTQCGGCDSIHTQQEIYDRVIEYAKQGHVLFEGLLLSGGYGKVGSLSEVLPDFVFATLDTPLDVCLDRVRQRRLKAGNEKPLNTKNTESKFKSTRQVHTRMTAEGKRAVWIDHTNAMESVLALLS